MRELRLISDVSEFSVPRRDADGAQSGWDADETVLMPAIVAAFGNRNATRNEPKQHPELDVMNDLIG